MSDVLKKLFEQTDTSELRFKISQLKELNNLLSEKSEELEKQLESAKEVNTHLYNIVRSYKTKYKIKSLLSIVDTGVSKRLMEKCATDKNRCWVWEGSLSPQGYGQISINNRPYLTHRVSLALFKPDLFEDVLWVDHTCKNRKCINPSHLRPVSQKINATENSSSAAAGNRTKTHCKHGHEFSPENTRFRHIDKERRNYGRICRQCEKEWKKKHRIKKTNQPN